MSLAHYRRDRSRTHKDVVTGLRPNLEEAMTKKFTLCFAFIASVLSGSGALSDEFGSAIQAQALLKRAVGEIQIDKLKAISEFNYNDARFRDRDLFVFCFNRGDGKFTAHEAMVSWDVRNLRDMVGKPFGEEMYEQAKDGQVSEVTFTSPIPGTTQMALRVAYVTAVRDQVCGVSAFRFEQLTQGK